MTTNSNTAMNLTKNALKTAIKAKLGVLSLKAKLIIGGITLAVVLLIILVVGFVGVIQGVISSNESGRSTPIVGYGTAQISAEVEAYRSDIENELEKYGMTEYTDLLLALMMQESGGRGNDPMQASESKCGYIGCITNPNESIKYGVKHFITVLEKANYDVKLTLQSYNFGGGFIGYVMNRGGQYTKELAIEFSRMMYQKLKHTGIYRCHRDSALQHKACYGDIEYVDAVLRYLPSAVVASSGSSEVLANGLSSPVSNSIQVTSPYGWRDIGAGPEHHDGIDFACTSSDSIHSVANGTVVYAGVMSSYGNLVQVQHDGFITAYAHLSSIGVSVGDSVAASEPVGMCGTTGRSTGTHLHFEVKTQMWGGFMNPAPYLGI